MNKDQKYKSATPMKMIRINEAWYKKIKLKIPIWDKVI